MHSSIIRELENAINSKSHDMRVETLRRVTDLFLCDAGRFDEDQIKVFDDVLCHLVRRMEAKALAELSSRLAPVDNAPIEVIRELARNDQIIVASPVLTQSARLTTDDLVEIAKTKSQEHLLAISGRARLTERVTDQILSRGNREVVHKLAKNSGARFSETGFNSLVKSAETDEDLAAKVGVRVDLPKRLLRELLARATESVRSSLLTNSPPELADDIQRVLTNIANEVSREASARRDYSRAQQRVLAMQDRGELNEPALVEFAKKHKYEEMVAALAALSDTTVDVIAALMRSERNDGMLIPCKAAGLQWPTVSEILKRRFAQHVPTEQALQQAKADYQMLSEANAQRTLRFWRIRTKTALDGV